MGGVGWNPVRPGWGGEKYFHQGLTLWLFSWSQCGPKKILAAGNALDKPSLRLL